MLTPEQITELRTKAGLSPTLPTTNTPNPADVIAKRKAALGITEPEKVQPTFKASIGGAETIGPNLLKMAGNVPSDIASTLETAVIEPAKKIGESIQLTKDIVKDRGVVQGAKDIVGGVGETLTKIGEAPGKLLIDQANKMDVLDALSPIQESAIKQRDSILEKLQEAKKSGKDTTHLVKALKYASDTIDSINAEIGSKEERKNKEIETYTNIAKYPIEHPVQTAIATETLKPETQATISSKIKPVTSTIEKTSNIVKTKVTDRLAKIAEDKTLNALRATEKTMTKSERLQAIDEGRQVTTKLGGVDYLPSKTEERAAKLLEGKLTSNAAKNVPIVKKEIAIRGKEAEKYLAKKPVKITAQEQSDMFSNARKVAEKSLTESELKAYDEQMKLFLKQIPGRGGYTTENFYKALKDYEANIADHLPRGKEALLDPTGVANAKIRAASDIRTVVRDAIGERHPEFKDKMFDLASLYDAKGNIITKAGQIKGNVVTRTLKNPVVKTVIGGTAIVGGAKSLLGD